jgi:hypothetical protein
VAVRRRVQHGVFNYNWAHYLESLRLLCSTGTGKPFRAGSDG